MRKFFSGRLIKPWRDADFRWIFGVALSKDLFFSEKTGREHWVFFLDLHLFGYSVELGFCPRGKF